MAKYRILLLFTGGTICSFSTAAPEGTEGPKSLRQRNISVAGRLLTEFFAASDSPFARRVSFDQRAPLDVFSENMSPREWERLLDFLRGVDFQAYDGVVIAHGTDTLAYTACLLALAVTGAPCPVMLVASNRPISRTEEGSIVPDPAANGNANFRTAVELIAAGIAPGVYVPYRNSDGVMYLHQAAHLRQCAVGSEDFFSATASPLPLAANVMPAFLASGEMLLPEIGPLGRVLQIVPYVGLDYRMFSLEQVDAVVHSTYHSGTACAGDDGEDSSSPYSVCSLLDRCREANIPVYLSPCPFDAEAEVYDTVPKIVAHSNIVMPLFGMTPEMSYVKTVTGLALGKKNTALNEFLQENIVGEICVDID